MGEFTNHISILSYAFTQEEGIEQEVDASATYYDMKMSNDAEELDITKTFTTNTGIGTNLPAGKFFTNVVGTYFFNLGFTFTGVASAKYKIRATLNSVEIDQSVIEFTTRGTGVMWEVGMTFLVKCDYDPNLTPTRTNGLYSSKNTIVIQYQNVAGEGNLQMVNGLWNVTKID